LDTSSGEKPGKSLKRGTSLKEDETVSVKCLSLPTVIQLTDVVAHPLYTLVFMLEYVISWPLTQNDKVNAHVRSMTKSQSQSVLVCWAAWTPTDATETHHVVELPLCGGAGTNPGQTLVFVGSDGKDNRVGDGDCGTVYFKYTLQEQRKKSTTEIVEIKHRARHPSGVVSDIGSELHTRRQSETETFHEVSESVVTQLEASSRAPRMLQAHMTPLLRGNVEHDGPSHHPPKSFDTPEPLTMQELTRRPATSTPADELDGQQKELSTLMYTPIVGVATQSTGPLYQYQVPFQRLTSTDAPVSLPESAPFIHSNTSIPRSAYAQLHNAGFPEVKDSEGRTPMNIDPRQAVTCNPERELKQPLQRNNITIQFLAISNVPLIRQPFSNTAGSAFQSIPLYKTVFFTFQFYRFQPITTERLLLSGLSSNAQFSQPSIHILSKLSGINSIRGYQVEFPVDPADFEPDESQQLVHYLYSQTLQIDVWDGESLFQIGTALFPLKHLIRQGREAVQVTHEVPITYVEYSSDSPTLIGDVIRSGSVRPAGVVSEIRGQLHVRLFNVGSKSNLNQPGPVPISVLGHAGVIPSDGNAMFLADGRLPSMGAEPHRVKARLLVESDKDLAAVLQSRRVGLPRPEQQPQPAVLTGEDLEAKQRKLSRMAMVRQLRGLDHIANFSSTNSLIKQRAQELRTISAFRERHKQERLLSALCQSITTTHTIRPSYGVVNFFEFILKNPYNSPLTVRIEWTCEDLLYELNCISVPVLFCV
jgi:nephrocystin-4